MRNVLTRSINIFDTAAIFFDRTTSIFGWINFEDVVIFNIFDQLHAQTDNSGDILEIGAHMGKTAVLLGAFLKNTESLHVCDVFDNQEVGDNENRLEIEQSYRDTPSLKKFQKNYSKFHSKPPIIYQIDSTSLESKIEKKTFRLIHIDGGHTYNIVKVDFETAANHIQDNGIIVVDDWSNFNTMDVSAVFWNTIMQNKLSLILVTHAKAYLSKGVYSDSKKLQTLLELNGISHERKNLFKQEFFLVTPQLKNNRYLWLKKILPPFLVGLIGKLRNRKGR